MNTWGGVCVCVCVCVGVGVCVCGERGNEITASIQGGKFIK